MAKKKDLPLDDVIAINAVLKIGISHTDEGDVLHSYAVDFPPDWERPEALKPVFDDMLKYHGIIALATGHGQDCIIFEKGVVKRYPRLKPCLRKEITDRMVLPSVSVRKKGWVLILSAFAVRDSFELDALISLAETPIQ